MEDSDIDLLGKTKSSLFQMFNLNMPPDAYHSACQQNASLVWKVLIMDTQANKVIAPIIHLTDLHMHNIVLHLPLKSKREVLRSVTILYLIDPTDENIKLIIQDCKQGLYDQFQLNFLRPPSNQTLSALAQGLAESQSLGKVLKIFEQHLNYMVLEPELFTLNGPSFLELNSPGVSDLQVEEKLQNVASSLFCVMKTCKMWPIIKAGPGMSEVVAEKLANLCWSQSEETSVINRPLLLILDRTTDFSVMLHHPWTYQALLFDVFENEANKIKLPDGSVRELDKNRDKFFNEQGFIEFDLVLQNIDKQFNEWREKYDRIGQNLLSVMENVEELTENKNAIDLHMMLASELVKSVKSRHLDVFNGLEEKLIKGIDTDLKEIFNKESSAVEFQNDLLRLKIIAYLRKNQEFDDGTGICRYLKTIFQKSATSESKLQAIYGKFKKYIDSNELVLPITRNLEDALDNKVEFTYFDTKFQGRNKFKGKFEEIIVFVVGGGSYTEYQNLMRYAQNTKKNIIYGSTCINTPNEFLNQIKTLAEIN
jgi:hypothetical protein